MPVRQPTVAGRFYPASRGRIEQQLEHYMPDQPPDSDLPVPIVAGIVPHAGWAFSGPTALKVYAAIQSQFIPETVVLVSAMHSAATDKPAIFSSGAWLTPLGEIPIDEALAQALLEKEEENFVHAPNAHAGEHSGEVQVPMIQHLFPDAQLLPIMIPPSHQAVAAGKRIGEASGATDKRVVVIGTTDLTHYGARYYGFAPAGTGPAALEWVRENDRRVIDLMVDLRAEDILEETRARRNACGGGAIAATVAAARVMGAEEGVLLEYTTSHDVEPRGPATDFVGYAAVVF